MVQERQTGTIGIIAARVCKRRAAEIHVPVRSDARVEAVEAFTTVVALADGGPESCYDLAISAAGSPRASRHRSARVPIVHSVEFFIADAFKFQVFRKGRASGRRSAIAT